MTEDAKIHPQMTFEEKTRRIALIHATFTPSAPISNIDLFAGRTEQIDRVFGAVFSPGQHAVIYGERGVGKSSLATIIYDYVILAGEHNFIPAKVGCSRGISFVEIWKEILSQMPVNRGEETVDLSELLPENPTSEGIRGLLTQLDNPAIVVIDEFDRVDQDVATQMSDAIKTISDRALPVTLVIVGVANSLNDLIEEHESVVRNLVQVEMQRMSLAELLETIDKGLAKADLRMPGLIKNRIATLSQGLPHNTHLLSKQAALSAVRDNRTEIDEDDYREAVRDAVIDKAESLGRVYKTATYSPKENIFAQVLLACALAANKQGVFSAKDVRIPLSSIGKQDYEIQAYIRHLDKFSSSTRGPVLHKGGVKRRFQYSFVEPLMQPYVILRGLSEGLVTEEQITGLESSSEQGQPS
jgi:hypothetical protein